MGGGEGEGGVGGWICTVDLHSERKTQTFPTDHTSWQLLLGDLFTVSEAIQLGLTIQIEKVSISLTKNAGVAVSRDLACIPFARLFTGKIIDGNLR